jgi:hypothetical protein
MPEERPEHREEIERARELTRNQLGSALENKASDAFCAAVAASSAPTRGLETLRFAEAMAAPGPAAGGAVSSVVEFRESPMPAALPEKVSPEAAEAVHKALEGVIADLPDAEKSLSAVLRQAGISSSRRVAPRATA